MAEKERLDVLLHSKNLVSTRERAKTMIMSGVVYVDGQPETKPGTKVDVTSRIEVKTPEIPYVSRGGLKLEKAIKEFEITLTDKTCMDVGASTGGFTDCMLQNHASKVFSVDVGYGQFAWKLRQDSRVVCMERTNIRYVTREQIGTEIDFASIDVSFISLSKVLPPLLQLLSPVGEIVALIKPQFEAGREKVGKKGVVRDPKVHEEVILNIWKLAKSLDTTILNLSYSPIRGPEGNIEYLIYITKNQGEDFCENYEEVIHKLVEASHGSFKSEE